MVLPASAEGYLHSSREGKYSASELQTIKNAADNGEYYPDNQTLMEKIEMETGEKELEWEWELFFEERDTVHNGEAFQNMLESLSDSYYVYECFGDDVELK